MIKFHIITIFPEMFDSYLSESIIGRAIKQKKIKILFYNPRKYVTGKYRKVWPDGNISLQVDDRPYGGGPGMVIRAEPIIKTVEKIKSKMKDNNFKIINFSPNGKKFDTSYAKQSVKKYTNIILICGRYEGIDSRVDKILKTELVSIGDYVLTGGELPAMVLIDSMSRQIEGVLGNFDSREEERISSSLIYTRPEVLEYTPPGRGKKPKKYRVPKVLLSGDHKKIEEWKKKR
jgi:tRNA (guanine37-N1)-methyltransferase